MTAVPTEIRISYEREFEDYFQGHGISYTRFTWCVTGIGDTIPEALDDALEQLATDSHWDTSAIACSEEFKALAQSPYTTKPMREGEHYYVSIDLR